MNHTKSSKRKPSKLSQELTPFRPKVPINVTISAENADYLTLLSKKNILPSHAIDRALTREREMEQVAYTA